MPLEGPEMLPEACDGFCPYCGVPGPPEQRMEQPPHFAPHPACEAEELELMARAYRAAYLAGEARLHCLARIGGSIGFATFGPGTLISYAGVAYDQLKSEVLLGPQAYFLEPEWW